MRHLADQALDRVARQSRVGVEGDDIADVGRRRAIAGVEERRVARAAQQAVELVQLAALALPAHPSPCASFQHAAPMEQQEAIGAGRVRIAGVEPGDAGGGGRQQVGVSRRRLGIGIGPVGQQREMDRRRPDWRDSEPPAARSARRPPHGSSAGSGWRPGCADAAAPRSRRSRPGSSVAPKPPVIARLTSINAASIAGSRPTQDHRRERPAGDADLREHEHRQEQNDGGHQGDAGDIARDARPSRSAAATRGPAGGSPSDRSKAARPPPIR